MFVCCKALQCGVSISTSRNGVRVREQTTATTTELPQTWFRKVYTSQRRNQMNGKSRQRWKYGSTSLKTLGIVLEAWMGDNARDNSISQSNCKTGGKTLCKKSGKKRTLSQTCFSQTRKEKKRSSTCVWRLQETCCVRDVTHVPSAMTSSRWPSWRQRARPRCFDFLLYQTKRSDGVKKLDKTLQLHALKAGFLHVFEQNSY